MNLPFNLGKKLAKAAVVANAISPELCLGGSILLGIACVVTSCVATVKSEPVVKKELDAEERIRKPEGSDKMIPTKELGEDERNELQSIRATTAIILVKNYAVPAVLGVASILLNLKGYGVLRRRLAETGIALAGLTKSFDEYRKRVIADQGAEKDQEYMHGLKKHKEVVVDPDTGEVTGENEKYIPLNKGISQYARWFDEGDWDDANQRWIHHNVYWKDDPWINQINLRSAEREMNIKLVTDGFLFLNDVYRRLGMPMSIDGQIVGWTYNGANGDHGVSFGVFDDDPRQLPCNKAFIEGKTAKALLDFNVDGPIINDLENFFGKDMAAKLVAGR